LPKRKAGTGRSHPGARLLVDSGAWIALRSRRDQHHADADRLFQQAISAGIPLITTNLVLAEVHRLTLHRAGVAAALRLLDRVDASSRCSVEIVTAADHAGARAWLERLAPHAVTYTDATSFAVMERSGISHVLGFDEDFAVAGFELWRGQGKP
jgi:predicted nucleic acid-binding protein